MPHSQLLTALQHALPKLRLSAALVDRVAYARDTWPLLQIRLQRRRTGASPELVAWPRDAEEVAAIFEFASSRKIPVVPVGAGSGVCGGAAPEEGCVVLDLKELTGPIEIDAASRTATAGVGWIGYNLEAELNRRGWTAGHFPSSIMCSTLGGWFAARGAGQLSTQYGKFEDRVRGVEWVFPDGSRQWFDGRGGEGILELLAGSEGTLGVATRIRFRIDPLPEARLFRAFEFDDVASGLEAVRELLHAGVQPAVVRLYDPLDTLLAKSLREERPDPEGRGALGSLLKRAMHMAERAALLYPDKVQRLGELVYHKAMLILMFEGPAPYAAWQATTTDELLARHGRPLGEAPARAWYAHRYDVSFKQSAVYEQNGFVDTMEVAFGWNKLFEGYEAVRRALMGEVLVLAHFSHVYPEGGSIYFTFTGYEPDPRAREALYHDVWRRGLDQVVRIGGTITHHHGVGLLKARWMADEWGEAYGWLRQLKLAIDPQRIANPGKLGL